MLFAGYKPNTKIRAGGRGFTLTELAIVLGVVGTLLASIWTAAGMVNQNNKTQMAVNEVAFIVSGYRSLYGAHGVDSTNNNDDVTCIGVSNGYFPAQMIPGGSGSCTCDSNGVTQSSCTFPVNPWGGWVKVQASKSTVPQGIQINLGGLDKTSCIRYASQMMNVPDIFFESINSVQAQLPPYGSDVPLTSAQIDTNCLSTTNTNGVDVIFRAK